MTTYRNTTCPDCGESYGFIGTRYYAMISHMVNKGEITIGEARAELASPLADLDPTVTELLAVWVMDRGDNGDSWRAGDPVRLPDGSTVPYADEQDWMPSGRVVTDDTGAQRFPWVFRGDPSTVASGAYLAFPAGSYRGGL